MADYIRVTALNALAKQWLAQCDPLNNLIVLGEISNFTRHYKSGHLYFTLKDEAASVKAVMFVTRQGCSAFRRKMACLCLHMAAQRCMSGTGLSSCISTLCDRSAPERHRWRLTR